MKKIYLLVVVVSVLILFTNNCKKAVQVEPVDKEAVVSVDEQSTKLDKPVLTEEELFQKKTLEELNKEKPLVKIHFDFDRYLIREDMKGNLHKNADLLLKHSTLQIQIEGHCDERGTVEYNMALGEKRAKATREYLESLGVDAGRISVISFGKNQPAVRGMDEHTYYLNRRAEFVIVKK